MPLPSTAIFFTWRNLVLKRGESSTQGGRRVGRRRAGLGSLYGRDLRRLAIRGGLLARRARPARPLLRPELVPEPGGRHLHVGKADDLVLRDVPQQHAIVGHRYGQSVER